MRERIRIKTEKKEDNFLKVLLYIEEFCKEISAEFLLNQEKNETQEIVDKGFGIIDVLFNENKIYSIIENVAVEITESVYEGEINKVYYSNIKTDLSIEDLYFYAENFVISMHALTMFPNKIIDVQLDYCFNIEDIVIDI